MFKKFKIFGAVELFHFISIIAIVTLASQNQHSSFNGLQVLGPMVLLPVVGICYVIYLVVEARFILKNDHQGRVIAKWVLYFAYAGSIILSILYVLSTYNGISS